MPQTMHVRRAQGAVATVATAALLIAALHAAPAAAAEETPHEATAHAAVAGLEAAGVGAVDDAALTQSAAGIADADGTVTIVGTEVTTGDFSIDLPTDTPLELGEDGLAAATDAQSGLGVVVAPVEGGTARLITVADESYSDTPVHAYEYDIRLQGGVELRQLSSGDVVIVDVTGGPHPDAEVELAPEVDPVEYEAGLAEAAEGLGADDAAVGDGEVVVGAFLAPWSVDADGMPLPTHYEIEGDTLVQVVDTEGAAFPVVSDPAPLIVLGLLAAARIFVAATARAFVTTAIRAGMAMTTRGGFSTFARFKTWAGNAKPNYQWHHVVEQGNTKFPAAAIHNPQNLVQIPTAIHQKCVNSWMAKKFAGSVAGFAFRNTATIRSQVRAMSWTNQHKFGVQLLRHCGINI